jgi:hypothetical protein
MVLFDLSGSIALQLPLSRAFSGEQALATSGFAQLLLHHSRAGTNIKVLPGSSNGFCAAVRLCLF